MKILMIVIALCLMSGCGQQEPKSDNLTIQHGDRNSKSELVIMIDGCKVHRVSTCVDGFGCDHVYVTRCDGASIAR